MRIARLRLLRYGALTDRDLTFRRDAAIHVVFGANETGKSTALAALSDLLFGFGHAKSHDFRHDAATLRVGATLEAGDGSSITFRRRRGNKNTLLSESDDEAPLRDDALLPYLGSVTRPIFERAFGLDSVRLRAGSEEMLASGGEMGTMLFAASSGILGLADTRRALEADAEKIFTPRKSGQRVFYQLLDRHEAARAGERNSELRATDWRRLNDEIERLDEEHEEKTRQRAALRHRQADIVNLTRLKPIVAEMDAEARELAAYADIADLPDDMGARLATALDAGRDARDVLKRAGTEVEQLRGTAGRIALRPDLVAHLDAIAALFEERGAVRKHLTDLPRIAAERDGFDEQLAELAGRLGLDRARFEKGQPSDPQIARIEDGLKRLADAEARMADIERRIGEDEATLRRLEQDRPQAALIDPAPWRARISAVKPDLDRLAALDAARGELAGKRRRLEEKALRLDPPVSDIDALARSPLPTRPEIARARDAINAALGAARSLRDNLDAGKQELADLDRAISADQSGSLATPQSIEAARAARDEAIGALASFDREALAQRLDSEIARIRSLVQAADVLADTAVAEAQQLALLTANLERRAALAGTIDQIERDLREADEVASRQRSDYHRLFARADIEARDPDAMMDWLSAVGSVLEGREEIESEAERIEAAGTLEKAILEPLVAIAHGIGVSGHRSLPVGALHRAIEERLDTAQRVWDDSRANAIARQQCEARLLQLTVEKARATPLREEAALNLTAEAATLGLGPEAGGIEIAAAIDAWKQVPPVKAARKDRDRRVRGMERDIAAFEDHVKSLVGELATDLARRAPADAIGELNERAREAKTAADREREARAELAEAEDRLAHAKRLSDGARSDMLAILDGRAAELDAATLAERLAARGELRGRLDACRRRFRQIAPEMDEDAARERLGSFDAVEAAADIERLAAEEASLDADVKETYAQLSTLLAQRAALIRSDGAERDAFERRSTEAELIATARQWAILKLSSTLLGAAIERQRQQSADPTLARAGERFRVLTSGAFSRLSRRFNDDDIPELVAVRDSGEEVGLEAMSDGTVDQLHLALRIAYLEDYAARNEPMPFIADDIFQTFDDARTGAAIAALGEASAIFQPIVFTHHHSVVEAARRVHGDRADILEL